MDSRSVSDAKGVNQSIGVTPSRRLDRLRKRWSKKMLARDWLNGNKLIRRGTLKSLPNLLKNQLCCIDQFAAGFSVMI